MKKEDFEAITPLFLDGSRPNQNEIDAFTSLFAPVTFLKKNDYIVRQGEVSTKFFYLKKGLVKFVTVKSSGEEVVKQLLSAPKLVGCSYAMLEGGGAWFSIQCIEDCEIQESDYKLLEQVFKDHPIWNKFGRVYYEKLFLDRERREMELLFYRGKERYERFLEQNPDLAQRVPLKDIASYLGMSAVQLSRIRSEMD